MAFDCKKCLHEKVCALWAEHERQDASCFCQDECDYFTSTLTQPNEPLTLEMVAEILAEQFGDECACNVNGNDEWLPMMCHYGDVCPDPPEHLGCWMELLRNKYRRPPEGEEEKP